MEQLENSQKRLRVRPRHRHTHGNDTLNPVKRNDPRACPSRKTNFTLRGLECHFTIGIRIAIVGRPFVPGSRNHDGQTVIVLNQFAEDFWIEILETTCRPINHDNGKLLDFPQAL